MKTQKLLMTCARALTLFIFISSQQGISQSWQDLGNPTVGTEEVGRIYNIEGFQSGVYLCTDKGLFVSTDNGANFSNLTWETGITAGEQISCLFIDESNGTLYAGGETTIYTSTNGGSSWSGTNVLTTEIINDIQKGSTNMVAAVGNNSSTTGGVLYSNDGFTTVQQATGLPTQQMFDLIYYADTFFLAGNAAMYASSDDGATWAVKGTGHPANGRYIKTLEHNTNLFSGDINGKGLFKSSDLGNTWALTDPGTFMDFCQIFDIAAGGSYLFATVDGVNCSPTNIGIRYSSDNGVSWNSGLFNLPQAFYDELGVTADGSCYFVYAPFEKKLYSSCDLPLGVADTTVSNIQVYPNPTDGLINISGVDLGKVQVFNAFGSKLKTTSLTQDRSTIDLSTFTAGIYFVSVESQRGTKTFKIVKN